LEHKPDCQMVEFPTAESAICTCGFNEEMDKKLHRRWDGQKGRYIYDCEASLKDWHSIAKRPSRCEAQS
jgi:hypothetical protein